jgi:predicted nuclease of restriction endonuclease-like RecB superfamily
MLPIELLRVRISSKMNQIRPVFCDYENELSLPSKIIKMYEEMAEKKVSKANVDENVSKLEAKYTDYKLVRGICHLLEQRGGYASYTLPNIAFSGKGNNNTNNAIFLRRNIFEESSRKGYPVTENERKYILQRVASKNKLTIDELELAMWNDLDKNKYLKNFDSLTPLQLVAWYNISILQTLLFNCVKLEFSVYGGFNWKKILRKIKQLGLMYFLYNESNLKSNNQTKNQDMLLESINDKRIICTVDGPLSIVRLTDRYGMAMAKLIPLIIFTDRWSIDATILRKSMKGIKKTHNFRLSNRDKDLPIFDASHIASHAHLQSEADSEIGLSFNKYIMDNFDSNVEKKFMDKFLKFSTDWQLAREPDQLILSDGKAFIPDFVFEKYGVKVYLEIVGFWTRDYLKRKLEKIKDLTTHPVTAEGTDLLIAANMDNYISENGDKIRIDSIFSKFIAKKNLIFYKKDEIPFGPIIKYLKDIDSKIIDDISINFHDTITREIEKIIQDKQSKVIFLKGISDKHNIPLESILKTIRNLQSNNDNSKQATTNGIKNFLLVDNYMISIDKINELLPELDKINKLHDAICFLCENNIPEECITLLIPKIGFEIVWNGIDSNNALIQRQVIKDS